jgi:hypothetical protein
MLIWPCKVTGALRDYGGLKVGISGLKGNLSLVFEGYPKSMIGQRDVKLCKRLGSLEMVNSSVDQWK